MGEIYRYPFVALVGQEKLKKAYLVNIVNPQIGGLLISGTKGTGKSTLVYSVYDILPEYDAVKDCPFNCDPNLPEKQCDLCHERREIESVRRKMKIVTLPLGTTEDRLIGSIDVEKLLKEGKKEVIPGILGEANRNILFVDEVNLLPDHLVDDLLDAAALHWNTIEREGISLRHPSEFVLVGTMNPEEGDLRPQILDRFPLSVKVETIFEPELRAEIVKRNILFENNPREFIEAYSMESKELKQKIIRARELLKKVTITEDQITGIGKACARLKMDGQRPDIVIVKTAMTLAAIDERNEVSSEDIMLAAELALRHRTRDGGLLEPPTHEEIHSAFRENVTAVKSEQTFSLQNISESVKKNQK